MSEPIADYACSHTWMILPSLNVKRCYDCGIAQPIDKNKPILNLPGETK